MEQIMKNDYMYNSKFRKYVDEYCNKYNCTIKEAFKSEKIKLLFWQNTDL